MFSYYTENKLHKNLNYCRKTWSSLLNKYKCSFLISNVYLNLIVKLSQLMCKYPFPPGPASLVFRDFRPIKCWDWGRNPAPQPQRLCHILRCYNFIRTTSMNLHDDLVEVVSAHGTGFLISMGPVLSQSPNDQTCGMEDMSRTARWSGLGPIQLPTTETHLLLLLLLLNDVVFSVHAFLAASLNL